MKKVKNIRPGSVITITYESGEEKDLFIGWYDHDNDWKELYNITKNLSRNEMEKLNVYNTDAYVWELNIVDKPGCILIGKNNSFIKVYGLCRIYAFGNIHILTDNYSHSIIAVHDNVEIRSYGHDLICAYDNTKVMLCGTAQIVCTNEEFNNALISGTELALKSAKIYKNY